MISNIRFKYNQKINEIFLANKSLAAPLLFDFKIQKIVEKNFYCFLECNICSDFSSYILLQITFKF